ncbi:MAG: protein phosphatase CheZ [Pseudomonadota bacterium]
MERNNSTPAASTTATPDVHQTIGKLTRQLHDALSGLGLTDKVKDLTGEIPDAKNRLSYIARLTGEAAEKVLNRVDQAKAQHDYIATETRRINTLLVKDPVAAVAKGHVMNFLTDVEQSTQQTDQHLTEIMMAQDFHDLTGQVIAKVINLIADIEVQLVELLIQTAPADALVKTPPPATDYKPALAGPAINPEDNPDVVTGQSEVDDLLASLGF